MSAMNLLVIADDEFVGRRAPDSEAAVLLSCGDMPDEVILAISEKRHCHETETMLDTTRVVGTFGHRLLVLPE